MKEALSYSGKTLKEIRVRKGIKLEDVSESTKVSKRHLINIEEENFSDLPAKIYFKGFLGSYASCLGINEDEVLKQMLDRFDQWENKLKFLNEEG
ncbi:MAG: helix-turn-helix domain-containing protein [Proteobacteria bacterium]|nr:helix-turn-helix domain-containing protein [Pseudomonadota bacterium]